mgnify:FL=1
MDEDFESLRKRLAFGRKALVAFVVILLSTLILSGMFTGKTDIGCQKKADCIGNQDKN